MAAHELASLLARQRPRLVAHLARALGLNHLAAAEDAVQQACLQALQHWPAQGLPGNPAGWLYRVAMHAALDALRRNSRNEPLPELPSEADNTISGSGDAPRLSVPAPQARFAGELDDDELALLFAACHPAVPAATQVLLALRTLTALDSGTLADAFFTTEAALAQRLARARKLLAGLPLAVPSGAELALRRHSVLDALALMFTEGMKASGRQGSREAGLAQGHLLCWEAMRLARAVAAHPFTAHPDAHALAACLLLHGARLSGRLDEAGDIIALPDQPRERWDAGLIRLGLAHLQQAQAAQSLSRHHLLAGIAAEHAVATDPAHTRWAEVVALYEALCQLDGGAAPRLGHAVALAEAGEPQRALALLQALLLTTPQALRAHVLAAQARAHARLGQRGAARHCQSQAIAQARHPADARLLQRRLLAMG